jgi:twitching motility protein PilU
MPKSNIGIWLQEMVIRKGSDLYLTVGAPPTIRGDDGMSPADPTLLDDAAIMGAIEDITRPNQREEFERSNELNFAIDLGATARFRVNVLRQRQHPALVIRRITTKIPTLEDLKLPELLGKLCLEKRGLVIMVGGTGSGKSTSLAAMVDYRNSREAGHIITIEDPIEYIHEHKKCLITQREVGIDTNSFDSAIKNALRQKPDIIFLGEIRDAETMENALNISETGHLCLATLHANNSNQAIERVVNFFDKSSQTQFLQNLSLNLKAIISQRLVPKIGGGRTAAIEIMLNQGLIKELIRKGEVQEIKPIMAQNRDQGMQTFDQCLRDMVSTGVIAEETALAEADNASDLKLSILQEKLGGVEGLKGVDTSGLELL